MLHFTDKQQLILAAMQAESTVTNERLAELLNVSTTTITKQLADMKHKLKASTRQAVLPLAWQAGWRPPQSLAEIVANVLDESTPPSWTRRADMQAEAVYLKAASLITYVRAGNEKGASVPVAERYKAMIALNRELRREVDALEQVLQAEKRGVMA